MLMKTNLLLGLIFLSASLFAQETDNDSAVAEPKTVVRIGVLMPALQVEQTIARNKTIVFDLWTGFSYVHVKTEGGTTSDLVFTPGITVQPRFYTNLEYRRAIHKTTDYYSGTYIGIPVSLFFKGFGMAGGVVGGFQKKLGNSGFWNMSVGVGIRSSVGKTDVAPLGDLSFGFIIK
jgi:hypothetical protein